MGIGFSQFALHHRLGCAAAELLESGKPVKAVAAEWGFTDTSHFYRRFGETYGCTPVDYRKIKLGKE
jgi:AraC-like DNA-binding protein